MSDPVGVRGQFLELSVAGRRYLLPSQASIAIEPRTQLLAEAHHPYVAAWRAVMSDRWPVYQLDGNLAVRDHGDWEKAVFIDAKPVPVGFAASELTLLPKDVMVEPLLVPGHPVDVPAHLFTGARVTGTEVTLVLSPSALVSFLRGLA